MCHNKSNINYNNLSSNYKCEPFKIGFDCGYIIEDTKDMKYTRKAPNEDEICRTIPTIIQAKLGLETYKHYVCAILSSKTKKIHEKSKLDLETSRLLLC